MTPDSDDERAGRPRRLVGRLPLLLKLLLPFLILELAIGYLGVGLLQRDLGARARASIDEDLSRLFFEERSVLHDRELYLVESVNLAANLQGMAEAVAAHDAKTAGQLVASVAALKTDLVTIAVTDRTGLSLADVERPSGGGPPALATGRNWNDVAATNAALHSATGERTSALVVLGTERLLVVVSPICLGQRPCDAAGVAIAGMPLDRIVSVTAGGVASDAALYDADGRLLARTPNHASTVAWPRPPRVRDTSASGARVRRIEGGGRRQIAAMYGPVQFEGGTGGILAVRRQTAAAYSSARRARNGLALVLLATMALTVLIGTAVARSILRQVQGTLKTVRSLGSGDLQARAPVTSEDELAQLARGVNDMAGQLSASYETLESRVAERTDEVRRLMQQRTEFFASLSHELRTPLAVIVAQAELLLDDEYTASPGGTRNAGQTMHDSAEQLLSVVNDILDFAKTEAGTIEVSLEPVAMSRALAELSNTIDGLTRTARLVWRDGVPADLPMIAADPVRLRAVLLNLVDNAVKYTPPGGVVTLSALAVDDRVEVHITDSGVGIPPELGEQIFEPFYRVRGTRTQRGQASTGLGLALSKRLVEAMDGTIRYESAQGRGTTFVVSLRVAEAPTRRTRSSRAKAATPR
jgi:signal transduction histidine kinase